MFATFPIVPKLHCQCPFLPSSSFPFPSPFDLRLKFKLLIHTYRCAHALASSCLCQEFTLPFPSNSTHSTARSQSVFSLCISMQHDALALSLISLLFTGSLLWNSLSTSLRSASSLHSFRQDLKKYLGFPDKAKIGLLGFLIKQQQLTTT